MRVVGVGGVLALVATLGARPGYAEPSVPWPALPGQGYGCYYILVDPRLYPRERLPHFALYPPVYYSLPVPRPYGHSPFAYPPGYLTPKPAPVSVQPVTILNPFVPGKPGGVSVPANRAAERRVRIQNPFVAGSAASAMVRSTVGGPEP